MKKFYIVLLFLFSFLLLNNTVKASSIIVLPETLSVNGENFLITPYSSEIIASNVINDFNLSKKISAIPLSSLKNQVNYLGYNSRVKKMVTDFKITNSADFDTMQYLARSLNSDYCMFINTEFDLQNYLMRDSLASTINIPGTTVVRPKYKLTTLVTLFNVKDETIIWQREYYHFFNNAQKVDLSSFFDSTANILNHSSFNNTIPVSDIKKYAITISPSIVNNSLNLMKSTSFNSVNSTSTQVNSSLYKRNSVQINQEKEQNSIKTNPFKAIPTRPVINDI